MRRLPRQRRALTAMHRSRLLVLIMAGIVGAACQPLQPPPPPQAPDFVAPAPVSTATRPASNAASPARAKPIDARAQPSPNRIALLLPLSGREAMLGEAVLDGFMAGYLASPPASRPEVLLFDDAAGGALEAYRRAVVANAAFVVGPLLKQSVQDLATSPGPLPVLALNNLDDNFPATAGFYQFGLAPEDEAREVARRAIALGQQRAIALAAENAWGKRVLNAFYGEFERLGGQLLGWQFYDTTETDHSGPLQQLLEISEGRARYVATQRAAAAATGSTVVNPVDPARYEDFRRQDIDLIFLAANAADARSLRPQLRFYGAAHVPTYATSAIYRDGAAQERDLEGLMFPDSPWITSPDDQMLALKNLVVRHRSQRALNISRLYALGHDAHELLGHLRDGTLQGREVRGMTGQLRLEPDGRVHRRLAWAQIRGGYLAPLPPADMAPSRAALP